MEVETGESGVRRCELTIPAGEVLPGEALSIGARAILPPAGAPLSGVAFYCLPGGGTNLGYFDPGEDPARDFSFAEAMARRGHVVIAADHPGLGRSTTPRDPFAISPDLLARSHARTAARTFDALREGSLIEGLAAMPDLRAVGCGHSMGAVMTMGVQAEAAPYDAIILLGYGTGGLPGLIDDDWLARARDPAWLRDNIEALARERFGTAIQSEGTRPRKPQAGAQSPSFHQDKADPAGRAALRTAAAPLLTLPGFYSMFPAANAEEAARVRCPVLVVTGSDDFIPAERESLNGFLPNAESLDIIRPDDAGHNLFIFASRHDSFQAIHGWVAALPAQTH